MGELESKIAELETRVEGLVGQVAVLGDGIFKAVAHFERATNALTTLTDAAHETSNRLLALVENEMNAGRNERAGEIYEICRVLIDGIQRSRAITGDSDDNT